jgi:beta-phosphoglucomutase-like phosphatase (HAD superfamily)
VNGDYIDVDALIGAWRAAFEAAQSALRSAGHDLPSRELLERTKGLADERTATARLLETLAHEQNAKPLLVRLVASSWEAKRLLGLPQDVRACVFNLEGVLIGSGAAHAEAWRETFDEFLSTRIEQMLGAFVPFDVHTDYPTHIRGRPRMEGVLEFLASRGISLPTGSPDDPPGAETVHGLANRKNQALVGYLDQHRMTAFGGVRLYLELVHDAGLRSAVVSASVHTKRMLDAAGLTSLVDARIDGNTMLAERLRSTSAAETLLAACRHLDVEPQRTAVFETSPDGVAAGQEDGFETIVGVTREGDPRALVTAGADLVVADLGEILERGLTASSSRLAAGQRRAERPVP